MKPTEEDLKIAKVTHRYLLNLTNSDPTLSQIYDLVEFLAIQSSNDSSEWKNAVLFSLTGVGSVCVMEDGYACDSMRGEKRPPD